MLSGKLNADETAALVSNLVPPGGALEIDNAQTRPPARGRSVSE
jgi:hypothetical protein